MIARYLVLATHIRHELRGLKGFIDSSTRAMNCIDANPIDRNLYLTAIALYLHNFYNNVEHVFEMIAAEVDGNVPSGRAWHRDLLTQMTLVLPEIRPAVLTSETTQALDEYLRFRHVVRNVYAFQFEMERLAPLVEQLPATYERLSGEIEVFVHFLLSMSHADEAGR